MNGKTIRRVAQQTEAIKERPQGEVTRRPLAILAPYQTGHKVGHGSVTTTAEEMILK